MNKNILITGAANGIGLASSYAFAEAGYNLALTDLDGERVKAVAQKIGSQACSVEIDVRNRQSIERAFAKAIEVLGHIDVVHANAGVSSMIPAVDLTEEDWDFNFDVNAKGVFLTNQIAVQHFLQKKIAGVIVNTASLAGKVGAPLLAHYSASKFAVLGWTQALAREHAKDNIRVNAVCPGFVKTPMQDREVIWEAKLLGQTPEEVRQSYIDQTPLGRLETPEDVAEVVVFLASDAARFMTGQGINVTGGVYMG
ncbi:MAG: SDR family oxidoreductase [Deltaproteobacteria bacterium]|jgi:meso-butanediol dehydrogenase / (S,S)-butanediol dehydrogenase / diacetyl reductase|nr:SDR family oxidoreductase [Deltaproteobacteria bacterium]MBT4265346.1 SDR family oxidoreductase [Deltaproteobacteria bacterium]MBT4638800.1 SDR family oxidoreductase [Deltaproteobacteria bacterium]MBT6502200.1 SDR family oxidoreductase [Deltaproteobacteria bacterium]MBT6612720.1 SDR family oxidoreductase [Deltaproteobacteria bacterium]